MLNSSIRAKDFNDELTLVNTELIEYRAESHFS